MSDPYYAKKGKPDIRAVEECAELVQAIAKARRFGWKKFHPFHRTNNTERVLEEIADVRAVINELERWIAEGRP